MAGYSAIADASETLLDVLRDRIAARDDAVGIDRNEIVLASPDDVDAESDVRLSLYLYKIGKSTHASSVSRRRTGDGTMENPSLSLDLHYMLTAYPSKGRADDTATVQDQHSVIGLAMQVLHDTSIIESDDLKGSLRGEDPLHLSMNPDGGEELETLWNTFTEASFQPSVLYEVSPVAIDSTIEEPFTEVTERDIDVDRLPDDPA
ncbi:Pvc16 family protein [Natronobiforma cellulositropha]|uniref:DUF4255 domain-containing protein n=1 Tax=Natronobiforma cellulositropha TaxID=1679076 RepID=UPI0021D5C50D|nr:DUF4255 domain-containing protein [Natronobiforma cellulositropha]